MFSSTRLFTPKKMFTLLLFIISILSFTKGFLKLQCFSLNLNKRLLNLSLNPFIRKNLNVRLTSTTYYDDEDENNKHKKKFNYNYDYSISNSDSNYNIKIGEKHDNIYTEKLDNDLLYTLIWYDCEECRNLLIDVKEKRKKILYIDGSYYFYDENDITNTPLFYKNDELIACWADDDEQPLASNADTE